MPSDTTLAVDVRSNRAVIIFLLFFSVSTPHVQNLAHRDRMHCIPHEVRNYFIIIIKLW